MLNDGDFEAKLRHAIEHRATHNLPNFQSYPCALERAVQLGSHYLGSSHSGDLSPDENRELINEVRGWIGDVMRDARGNAVYMDGTTLHAVDLAITKKYLPHAEVLYDLATFVEGAVWLAAKALRSMRA